MKYGTPLSDASGYGRPLDLLGVVVDREVAGAGEHGRSDLWRREDQYNPWIFEESAHEAPTKPRSPPLMPGHTIRLHRVFKAPPERVYRAFLEPEALVRWMAPYGFTAAVHSIDARVGGGYKMSFTNFGTGSTHSFGGTYTELVPNELIRYTDAFDDPNLPGEMAMTVSFKKVMCGTELTIEQAGVPEAIPAEMCYLGWQESLEQLARLVEPEIPDGALRLNRARIAALQYFVRPIRDFSEFRDQVAGLVHTAADYDCDLLVFPEYFTVQLLTLGDIRRPMDEQIRDLSRRVPDYLEVFESLSRSCGIHIVAGSIATPDPGDAETVYNDSYFFASDGTHSLQGKLNMTRFEKDVWRVSPRDTLRIFETPFGRVAITICYDVEFPEVCRAAAQAGAVILVVPSYTDDRQGFVRVRYCAQARAIENQMFVVNAGTVGSLPSVPAVSLNYGQASILTPSDFPFARDGVLAEGIPNQETMVIGEVALDVLRRNRAHGTVRPLLDSKTMKTPRIEPVALPVAGSAPSPPRPQRPRRRIVIRNAAPEHFKGIAEIASLIYPDITPWSDEYLESHLNVFPQGQIVAIEQRTGLVVGVCSGLVIDWDKQPDTSTWNALTAGGMYTNHDPINGSTLFAADVMVRPGFQGSGIGRRLYDRGRFDLARQLGLWRIVAGSRLRGYHRFAESMSAEEYVVEVVNGRLNDPTLSFQLHLGFRVTGVVSGYFGGDPESRGWAAVIEWLNDEVAGPDDHLRGDPRFAPEK
ncbi:yhcX [Symbiodinium necroappetens]|uniref:YhcX protein n=1 Tax=Symbiodinium necroappetens TaxID=1628268 RepID=A0A812J6H2_9DINO|nr:yhcX [Symbiodinium necroappetens]